jgi:hypothetical protein
MSTNAKGLDPDVLQTFSVRLCHHRPHHDAMCRNILPTSTPSALLRVSSLSDSELESFHLQAALLETSAQ